MGNAHYDAARFLLSGWDVVLCPLFQTQRMVQHDTGRRVIGKHTARDLYCWSHYTFRQRLISKAKDYPGRVVVEIGEPGTSGTCGRCGTWNPELGGNLVFRCINPDCGVVLDRDVNGARNNLLAAYGVAMAVAPDDNR